MNRFISILSILLVAASFGSAEIPDCYKVLPEFENETDIDKTDTVIYDGAFKMFSGDLFDPAFLVATEVPCVQIQAVALKAIFDKIHYLHVQNGAGAAKTFALAKKLIEHEEIKNNKKSLAILNDIIDNSPKFAQAIAASYLCQDKETIKYLLTGEEIEQVDHNEYLVFYNYEESDQISNGKFIEKSDGDLMMITAEGKREGIVFQYSILMNKDDYPEDLQNGNFVSRKIIGKEPSAKEEVCGMNPQPVFEICAPANEIFSGDLKNARKIKSDKLASLEELLKKCNEI